jgi:hypothetical protein
MTGACNGVVKSGRRGGSERTCEGGLKFGVKQMGGRKIFLRCAGGWRKKGQSV